MPRCKRLAGFLCFPASTPNEYRGQGIFFLCGDGGNDASMRMACGCFVAPNNAEPEALAAADVRTAPAAQDGVANWILEQFLAP